MTLQPGTVVLDRYVIERTLGAGAMGAVYLGRHARLGMKVAIKVMTGDDTGARARFLREAEVMARVRNTHVVTILDIGNAPEGQPSIAMEFVEGESLEALMRRGLMSPAMAVDIAIDILTGLKAVHEAGVVHRDLKPANVMLAAGDPLVAKVVDFGIAQEDAGRARLTRTGMVAGTPAYMSPEQMMDLPVDGRTDLYALGLILHEALSGHLPFPGETGMMAQVMRRLMQPVPPLPGLPNVSAAIASLLTREPADRVTSAAAGLATFRAIRRTLQQQQLAPSTMRTQLFGAMGRAGDPPHQAPAVPIEGPRSTQLQPPLPGGIPTSSWLPTEAMEVVAPATRTAPPARWAVAALLPAQRLAIVAERQWLATMVQPGRGFRLGDALWFAVTQSSNEGEAFINAELLVQSIADRFGPTARAAWSALPVDFSMTAASVTGASALPPELQALVASVTRSTPA